MSTKVLSRKVLSSKVLSRKALSSKALSSKALSIRVLSSFALTNYFFSSPLFSMSVEWSDLGPKCANFSRYGTNPGLFHIRLIFVGIVKSRISFILAHFWP